ncbi:MAG: alkaline phosphatase family protein [Phycisphaerales bacterium]|nr:alkaline phosphatase family protein [Phycisphaerales bacterium]
MNTCSQSSSSVAVLDVAPDVEHAGARANTVDGVGSAIGAVALGSFIGLAAGLLAAYRIGSDNRLTGADWRAATWGVAGAYLLGAAILSTGAAVIGSWLGRLRRNASAAGANPGRPVVMVLACFAALAVYGASGRVLENVGLPGRVVLLLRPALALAAVLGVNGLAREIGPSLAFVARGRVLAPCGAVVVLAYIVASSAAAGAWSRKIAEGETRFAETTRAQTAAKDRRVLLIGLDGACWAYVEDMMQRGELPTLSRLAAEGVAGPLKSFQPTQSPLIWTSMATGVGPQVHGVESFTAYRLPGVSDPILQLAPGTGFHKLLDAGEAMGLVHRQPVTARCCRKPRVWDILSATGVPCAVLGWWATWPARDLNGVIVTDTFFYERHAARLGETGEEGATGTVSPAPLLKDLAPLRVNTSDLTAADVRQFMDVSDEQLRAMHAGRYDSDLIDSEFLFLLAMDRTYRNVAVHLMKSAEELRFVTVYLRGIDILGHAALRYGTPLDRPPGSGPYADTVRRYYMYSDSLVQELLDAAGEDTTVVLVSDHGFERQPDGTFGHDEAPDGVMFARGEPFRTGERITEATVYDVMPTLLHLYGLATPEDGKGRALTRFMRETGAAGTAPRRVATYGYHLSPIVGGAASPGDQEAVKRLRALGYLDKEGQESEGE